MRRIIVFSNNNNKTMILIILVTFFFLMLLIIDINELFKYHEKIVSVISSSGNIFYAHQI